MTGIEIIAVKEIAREIARENVLDVVESASVSVSVSAATKETIPIQESPRGIEVKRKIISNRLLLWLEE